MYHLFCGWTGILHSICKKQHWGLGKGANGRPKCTVFYWGLRHCSQSHCPCLTDKLHDSPVLVADEKGQYLIPILSGHVGGANALASWIAEKIGAEPVITTATDLNRKFAVDLFAKKNGLFIVNRDGIAKVSAKVLSGQTISMSVETGHLEVHGKQPDGIHILPYPPAQQVDVMVTSEEKEWDAAILLKPREYVIGMGCRRGKEAEQIDDFIRRHLEKFGIVPGQVVELASIDRKRNEPGLLAWSRKERIPFRTYTAEELQSVKGTFQTSDFVQNQVEWTMYVKGPH